MNIKIRKIMCFSLAVLFLAAILVGCSSKPKDDKVIRVGYPSAMDLNDVPSLMAWDEFMPKGYKVDVKIYDKTDVATKALLSGEVDVAATVAISLIQAVIAGANIKAFVTEAGNEWLLLTPSTIKTPKDLDGKRIAYHGPVTNNEGLVKWFAKSNGITPEWLIIPGSENRAAAILKGQIEATASEIVDVLNLEKEAPGKFHVLADFTGAYRVNAIYTTTDEYLKGNKDALKALTKAVLQANRKANQDAEWVISNAKRLLPGYDEGVIRKTVKVYQDMELWGNNGLLDEEIGKKQMGFYKEVGLVKEDLKFSDWATTEVLDEVLKDLGRK